MSYPGNPNVSQEIQQKISSTFQQVLTLLSQGREKDAVRGCELILRADPQNRPAQELLKRLQSSQRPIVTQDLESLSVAPAPAPPPRPAPPPQPAAPVSAQPDDLDDALDNLDDLDDLGDLDQLTFDNATPSAPAPQAPPTAQAASGLATVLQDLIERRNFKQVLQIAESQRSTIMADSGLQAMVQMAQQRLESEPYVQTFLESANKAWAEGLVDDAKAHLEKARALDRGHPEIARLSAEIAAAPTAPDGDDLLSVDDGMPELTFDDDPVLPGGDVSFSDDLDPVQDPDMDDLLDEMVAEPATAGPPSAGPPPPPSAVGAMDFTASDHDGEMAMGLREAGGGSAFDDSDDDGVERVSQLLDEGQEKFDQGEYQAAINVWSRIFLIELDNQDASQRIEKARNKKAELERQAEQIFHEGIDHLEKSELEEARASFQQVLELNPDHGLAREYVQQLDAGQVPTVMSRGDFSDMDSPLPPGVMDPEALQAGIMPDGKSMEAAVQRDRITVVKKTDKRLIMIGAAVLVLVVAATGFLVTKWDDLFPNAAAPTNAGAQIDPIERAVKMHEEGNTANAIILLEKILPIDPLHGRAQALVAEWRQGMETEQVPEDTGPGDEDLKRRGLLLTAGREAHDRGQYIRAQKYLDRANRILPLEADDLALRRDCDEKLLPLADEMLLFQQGDYAKLIPELWHKRDEAPEDPNIEMLLIDSYYNFALRDLQRGNPSAAAEKLADALLVDPDSEELERLLLLSKTYSTRPQDLLFRIMIKYLPSRS